MRSRIVDLDYLSELENWLRRDLGSIRERVDQENELLSLHDDVPYDNKEFLELKISVLLYRLQKHQTVWSNVLAESKKRTRTSYIKRVK